ncbi:MAG: hypothetical protein LBT48_06745 [Prevotellaceae bacterium]|jgi:hypothetical protein|nr:hypothetical protein [Prevotellaceae bacterium]
MIRTIFIPNNDNIVFPIPKDYVGKELEIIVFPTEEVSSKPSSSKEVTFNAISIDTRKYKFDREEANAR